jgi:hypothetical protein
MVVTNHQSDAITMDTNAFKLIEINPGNTAGGYVVFDVPKNANIVKMQFRGGMTEDDGEVPFKIIMAEN